MTPKEKAAELVEKYDETLTYLESKSKAKYCALIAVYEIINSSTAFHAYWKEVKSEIESYETML